MSDIFNKLKNKHLCGSHNHNLHHCLPNINININNDENDSGASSISPIIIDLINRLNNVENKVDDFENITISGSNIQLGENEGNAYPGEKGAKNASDIIWLTSNVNDTKSDLIEVSGRVAETENNLIELSEQLLLKADKTDIPQPEIYYVNDFNETPQISGLYIKGNETKFWDGNQWHEISLKTSSNLSNDSSNDEIPTAKAVFDALSGKLSKEELNIEMDKYATDDEVVQIINEKINSGEFGGITGNEQSYADIVDSIKNFNNNIN